MSIEAKIDRITPPTSATSLPYTLRTAVILTRAPLLTREPTSFEAAYYAYQTRLTRALSEPFPSDFYFKKGTLLERRFKAEERVREAETFGEGFESDEGEEKVEDVPSEEDEVKVLPRLSDADRTGDLKSLNRYGDRSLYLLVKNVQSETWYFPHWSVGLSQPLHTSVRDALLKTFGPNMNTWLVGRQPIAVQDDLVHITQSNLPSKTFYFKARILGGRPRVEDAEQIADLAWLTKEEIRDRVDNRYWNDVDKLLPKV